MKYQKLSVFKKQFLSKIKVLGKLLFVEALREKLTHASLHVLPVIARCLWCSWAWTGITLVATSVSHGASIFTWQSPLCVCVQFPFYRGIVRRRGTVL